MSNPFIEYSNVLAQCMISYQFIEEGIKFCLYRCHAIIKFRLWDLLPYDSSLQSIDNAALGKLIEQYKIFTKNETLIKNLRSIQNHRNTCAHKGYLLTSDEQCNADLLKQKQAELEGFLSSAKECMELLKPEMEYVDQLVEKVYAELKTEKKFSKDIFIEPPLR